MKTGDLLYTVGRNTWLRDRPDYPEHTRGSQVFVLENREFVIYVGPDLGPMPETVPPEFLEVVTSHGERGWVRLNCVRLVT